MSDGQFWIMILKLIILLPLIIFIIYITFRYGGIKFRNIQNGRYVRILDRIPLSKDNTLLIVKIGEKGYIMTSTHERIEILQEIKNEDLLNIQKSEIKIKDVDLKGLIKKVRERLGNYYDKK